MTILEMLVQSGILAVLGIGVVLSFLVILVVSVSLLGKILSGKAKEADTAISPTAEADTDNNARITAAISASVTEYQKTH